MAAVYLHRKEIDNSIYYIGIGNHQNRAREIRGRSSYWTRTFNKYGRNIEIVANDIDLEAAKELEIFLIQEIGIKNLCNHTLGGEGFFGGKHTKESKVKMRLSQLGKKRSDEAKLNMSNARLGFKLSDETKAKISKSNKGNKCWCEGKKHSKESILKMEMAHKNTRPTKKCLDSSIKIRRNNGIKIKELTTGVTFLMWESDKYFNINKRTIAENSLTDKPLRNKKHKGFNFTRLTT